MGSVVIKLIVKQKGIEKPVPFFVREAEVNGVFGLDGDRTSFGYRPVHTERCVGGTDIP